MRRFLLFFMIFLNFFAYTVENEWQDNWLNGLDLISEKPLEAKNMFENTISLMTTEEFQSNLNIALELAQVNLILKDFDTVLELMEKISKEEALSECQKIICGNLIVSAYWNKGDEENAIHAYFKYIIKSPLAPRCYFRDDRIFISNVPSCNTCKNEIKNFLIMNFCENEEDFIDHGDLWAIHTTKGNIKCCKRNQQYYFCKNKDFLLFEDFKANIIKRNPETIRACCNTCSTLAVSAGIACQYAPNILCRAACTLFVEGLRQICEECCYNGGINDRCWENFSFWKDLFHSKNQRCSHPKDWS